MNKSSNKRLSTGVSGLDKILDGGLISQRAYVVRGGPGSGKTTLGLHFLSSQAEQGKNALFISLVESKEKIKQNAANRGFKLKEINFLDLSPSSELIKEDQNYTVFPSSEVEQRPLIDRIIDRVEEVNPEVIFLDSLAELRYLAVDGFQFRKQILSFIRFAISQGSTVLLASEASRGNSDDDLKFISDGIINLLADEGGRFLKVSKFRGSDFYSGLHSMLLDKKGIRVYPRIKPENGKRRFIEETISSGIPELDELFHGGVERGTDTIISGPSGVGKTTLGIHFVKEAAGRGENSIIYTFEEGVETLVERCESINIPIRRMVDKGTLRINKVNPLEYTPDQFSFLVQEEVEELDAKIVMLDSISGYRLSFQNFSSQEDKMVRNLHAISEYLTNQGVTVLLINETQKITGDFRATDYGISYMADNILFLRYLEMQGEIHKAIGVLKKRLSDFEKALREIEITEYGIKVGKPLTGLRGILTGKPEFVSPQNRSETE